jgi:hypothetical protein
LSSAQAVGDGRRAHRDLARSIEDDDIMPMVTHALEQIARERDAAVGEDADGVLSCWSRRRSSVRPIKVVASHHATSNATTSSPANGRNRRG